MASTGFRVGLALLSLLVFQLQARGVAAQDCLAVGQLFSIDGQVEVQREVALHEVAWQPASLNQSLCKRDTVRTGPRSRAAVRLINEAVLRLDQNTTLSLIDVTAEEQKRSLLDMVRGAIQSLSRRPRGLEIDTPYLNAAIEGTEFAMRAEAHKTTLTVFEGVVTAANEYGRVAVASGQSVVASAGQAPRPFVLVRPRDAVQWALYYPPVLAISGSYRGPGATGAFAALDQVPEGERDARFDLRDAALLLSVGRVDEARAAVDRALTHDPRAGLAYALRAVIALVQNDKASALADAQRGVELEPEATAPRIALSYVQQANFDLKAARETLLQATAAQPQDALAWARLAELWLMLGYRDRSREAAETAVRLAPELERVHLVFGFAALTEYQTKTAREAFERAIELDSADPLPRFGLGLAIIRDGDLVAGRRQLEMAVGLDSSNSLLRSYLGKAYFEEKRDPLDGEQLTIAKSLDPLDPTPYLYDALRKQSINRPVEALQDMQASIERNDNRAIYRSREALDQDRAARGASLARIYDDLGFEQLGVNEASNSLTFDPGSTSAHRFLSDIYIGTHRREIARVSELFQAQMLQDININPVQPSLSDTNLGIAARGGPTKPGFNEFTPMFERNDLQVIVSSLAGNEETFGAEGVASAIFDQSSISAGDFHYETEGWRPNNDIRHDIYNFFMQSAVTPDLNMQVELRHRESEQGDLAFNFDPNSFNPDFTRSLNQDTGRVGARYSPSPNSDLLLSFIYTDSNERQDNIFPDFDITLDTKTYQVESQYIYRREWFNLIAGLGHAVENQTIEDLFGAASTETTHLHSYAYTNVKFPDPVTWTLGVAFDDFEQDPIEVNRVSPKLGVRWDITSDLSLRGAVFRWIKPALSANRTLEPTQVSGFDQVFDDANGDESWRYGVGLDWRATNQLFAGAEAAWRDMNVAITSFDAEGNTIAVFEPWREQLHRAYLFWTPTSKVSLSGQVVYDAFEAETGLLTSFSITPLTVKTLSVPLAARYFHPSGFFAGVGVTYVNQEVVRSDDAKFFLGLSDGEDTFSVVDMAIGWRFSKRMGIASLSINNLFNEKFQYQDDSFREFRLEPSTGPYTPGIKVMGRVTLDLGALSD